MQNSWAISKQAHICCYNDKRRTLESQRRCKSYLKASSQVLSNFHSSSSGFSWTTDTHISPGFLLSRLILILFQFLIPFLPRRTLRQIKSFWRFYFSYFGLILFFLNFLVLNFPMLGLPFFFYKHSQTFCASFPPPRDFQ